MSTGRFSQGDLASELQSLERRFDDALAAASDEDALEATRVAYLGRSGEVTRLRRTIGTLSPAERPGAGKLVNETVAAMEVRFASARGGFESEAVQRDLERSVDVTFPADRAGAGIAASRAAHRRRCVRILSPARIRGGHRPRDRTRLLQLRRTEHSRRSSGARRFRFVLAHRHAAAAAAHVADADSHDAAASAAGRDRGSGKMFSSRRPRRAPPLSVSPNRRTARRARHSLRPSQGDAHRDVPRDIRRLAERALSAVVLSVHRTQRRGRHDLPEMQRFGRSDAACAADPDGSNSAARGWCIPTCCARSDTIRTSTPAGRSDSASSDLGLSRYGVDDIRRFVEQRSRFSRATAVRRGAPMLVPIGWLREFVDVPGDAEEIAERLAMLGFPVEEIVRRPRDHRRRRRHDSRSRKASQRRPAVGRARRCRRRPSAHDRHRCDERRGRPNDRGRDDRRAVAAADDRAAHDARHRFGRHDDFRRRAGAAGGVVRRRNPAVRRMPRVAGHRRRRRCSGSTPRCSTSR